MTANKNIVEQEKESQVEQIEMPTLSVDETQEVEQRMTGNTVNNILPARYLKRDENGDVVETPDELFRRVATNVAKAEYTFAEEQDVPEEMADARFEEWQAEFYDMMSKLQFTPNSPTLMNAGARLQQLSACFVNSPADSLEDIGQTEKEWTLVQKTGGGMGGDFSSLRPKGAFIGTTKGTSSGPLSFMSKFNMVAGVIKQGGVRRGAQMAEMRVDHPDIARFATAKRKEYELDNFNISVSVTDEFIEAVREDEIFTFYDPESEFEEPFEYVNETVEFYAVSGKDKPDTLVEENLWRDFADGIEAWDWENEETVPFCDKWQSTFEDAETDGQLAAGETMELPARFIWDIVIDGAWRNGEPGLFHLDETRRMHSFDGEKHPDYEIYATNPCAEQPLAEYEACNLGHINLSLMMKEDAPTYAEWGEQQDHIYQSNIAAATDYFNDVVDTEELDRIAQTGTRFLDNVVTQSEFPLDKITERVRGMRKIGLGVMGWAQMLYQMGVSYGSESSLHLARVAMNRIDRVATETSHELAKERGSFEVWDSSKYANPTEYPEWFAAHTYSNPSDWEDGFEMRNHNVTTVAPTGTTSMIADTSGGIEPVYNVAYRKNVSEDIQGDDMLVEFDSYFISALEANDVDVDAVKEVASEQMRNNEFEGVQGLPVPEKMKDIFVTTNDISSRGHGLMQRAFQEGVDSGISKTVNLPKEATHKDVHEAYMLALADSSEEIGETIKGLTVYRDQSRETQVLTTQEYSDIEVENAVEMLEELGYSLEEPEDDE